MGIESREVREQIRSIYRSGWGVDSVLYEMVNRAGAFAIVEIPEQGGALNEMWYAVFDKVPTDAPEAGWYTVTEVGSLSAIDGPMSAAQAQNWFKMSKTSLEDGKN